MLDELLKTPSPTPEPIVANTANVGNSEQVIRELVGVLKQCEEGGSFCVFLSRLYKEGKEDKLKHHMFTLNFKNGDLPIALTEYQNLAEDHLQKVQLENAPLGAVKAPVEENAKIDDRAPQQAKEEFKVEDTK